MMRYISLLMVFLMLLPNIILAIGVGSVNGYSSCSILYSAILLQIFLFALVGNLKFALLIQIPFFLWLPVEVVYTWRYLEPTNAQLLGVLLETNVNEIKGYMGDGGYIFYYFCYIFIAAFALYQGFKKEIRWQGFSRWFVLIIGGTYIFGNSILMESVNSKMEVARLSFIGEDKDRFVEPYVPFGLSQYSSTYPFGLPVRFWSLFQQYLVLKESKKNFVAYVSPYERLDSVEDETHVVVIGESVRGDHWGLNGYTRNTTPLLSVKKGLVNFNDVVSVATLTRISVPSLLSRSSVTDIFDSRLQASWILDFKQAGFHTYWLSMQEPVGTHDTAIGVYAGLTDTQKYLSSASYKSERSDFDIKILQEIKNIFREQHKKKLIVLHILGSHAPYNFRYPEAFSNFKPDYSRDEVPDIFNQKEVIKLRNSYDNSVLYTDYVLSSIIDFLEENASYSTLIYTSDHGQTFIDEGCNLAGHGFGSRQNFHVPFIFWGSEHYYLVNSDIYAAANRNSREKISLANFYDSVLNIAGFDLHENAINSFFNLNYKVSSRMVASAGSSMVDYDDKASYFQCNK